MKVKNTSAGPRGLNTTAGPIMIEPGQIVEVEIDKSELGSAKATGWYAFDSDIDKVKSDDGASPEIAELTRRFDEAYKLVVADNETLKADLAARDAKVADLEAQLAAAKAPAAPADGGSAPSGYAVKEKAAGWLVITQDGAVVTKSLRKDDVEGFDTLSDADKAAFVERHKVEG